MRRSFFSDAPQRATLAASALALCSVVLAAPAWAQGNPATSTPVTRAQVRAELDELVGAGYNPRDWYHYPDNLWAAQRIVEQRHAALAQANPGAASPGGNPSTVSAGGTQANESMGGVVGTTSEAGAPAASSTPVTRAQVRAELEELVGAGYNPRDWYHYPDNLWAAQRIVEQRHAARALAAAGTAPHAQDASKASAPATQTDQSMGGVQGSTSAAGGPVQGAGSGQAGLRNESGAPCVRGPQCDIFFGHH